MNGGHAVGSNRALTGVAGRGNGFGVPAFFHTIRARLVVLLIALIVVPVLVGFWYYNRIAGEQIATQLTESRVAVARQTALAADRVLADLGTATNLLIESTSVQRHLSRVDTGPRSFLEVRDVQRTMELISVVTFEHSVEVFLLSSEGLISTVSDNPGAFDLFSRTRWYEAAAADPGRMHWTRERLRYLTDEGFVETDLVTAARAVLAYDRQSVRGVAAVSIRASDVTETLAEGMTLATDRGPGESGSVFAVAKDDGLHVIAPLENGWSIEYDVPGGDLLSSLRGVQRTGALVAVSVLMAIAAIVLVNVIAATRTLKELATRIEQVKDGDFTVRMPVARGDEIGAVAAQFNAMLDQIDRLFREAADQHALAAEQHALAEEARVERLRSQIQPHFLMNSLNTIRLAATMSGADNVSRLAGNLSAMLDRALYHDSPFARLSEEITATREFLAIEEYRTGDQWAVEIDVDSVPGDPWCPFYTIQPLVENAIKHGGDTGRGPLRIRVLARRAGDDLEITVTDDGSGPGPAPPPTASGGTRPAGVGLNNLRERLRAFFGTSGSLSMEPGLVSGTVVTVQFPYRTEEP